MDEGRFGPYRLEGLIGRGGMGEVHRAVDTRKNRTVALKLLPSEFAANGQFRARFRLEAEATGRLSDPHVIPIHDFGEIDGQFFIDMRLVDGVDLATLVDRDGPMSMRRAAGVISQIAGALDAAHRADLVHRDVKPTNVLINDGHDEDFVYLIDFGVVRAASIAKLTVTGSAVGTLGYMAPERFLGTGGDGPETDIYALGCVLYEILTGETPFGEGGLPNLMYAHIHTPPPRPTAVRPDLPAGIDDVVARAMAKTPQDRYATAGRLAAAVQEAATSPPPAPPAPVTRATPVTGLDPAPRAAPAPPAPPVRAPLTPSGPTPVPAAVAVALFRRSDRVALWVTVWFVAIGAVLAPTGTGLPGPVLTVIDVVVAVMVGLVCRALGRDESRSVAVYTGAAGGLAAHHFVVVGVGLGDYPVGAAPFTAVVVGLVWTAIARPADAGLLGRTTARTGALVLTCAAAVAVPLLTLQRTAAAAATRPQTAYVVDQIVAVVACGLPVLAIALAVRSRRGEDRVFGGVLAATAVGFGLHLAWRQLFAAVTWTVRQYQEMPSRYAFVAGTAVGLALLLAYLVQLARDRLDAVRR